MATLLGSLVAGCVTDPGEEAPATPSDEAPALTSEPVRAPAIVAPERNVTPGEQTIGPTSSEWPLWSHGGGGGNYTGHVTPPGVIYAVRVFSGIYVDSISFAWYQPTSYDNLYRAGDAFGATPAYGGAGGGDNGWWYCPAGKGVIGLRGSAGGLVDRVGVICGDVSNPDPNSQFNTNSPLWGGSGGWWFGDDRCSAGRLVDSFNVRAGGYLDNLQAICVNAH